MEFQSELFQYMGNYVNALKLEQESGEESESYFSLFLFKYQDENQKRQSCDVQE